MYALNFPNQILKISSSLVSVGLYNTGVHISWGQNESKLKIPIKRWTSVMIINFCNRLLKSTWLTFTSHHFGVRTKNEPALRITRRWRIKKNFGRFKSLLWNGHASQKCRQYVKEIYHLIVSKRIQYYIIAW